MSKDPVPIPGHSSPSEGGASWAGVEGAQFSDAVMEVTRSSTGEGKGTLLALREEVTSWLQKQSPLQGSLSGFPPLPSSVPFIFGRRGANRLGAAPRPGVDRYRDRDRAVPGR